MNIRKPQMSVNSLSINTIKQMPVVLGEVDVIKSITLLPGVTNAGEGSSGFNVRGGSADQNLILLDEATIFNSSHLFGFFSVFNPDAIKDIKLYKGGVPAKYGGRVSSVLDIYQKEGNNEEFNFNIPLLRMIYCTVFSQSSLTYPELLAAVGPVEGAVLHRLYS